MAKEFKLLNGKNSRTVVLKPFVPTPEAVFPLLGVDLPVLQELSQAGEVVGAVLHGPDPHHCVGVLRHPQHPLQGQGVGQGGRGPVQVGTALGE